MVKMVATKPFAFAGRTLQVGECFTADDAQQAATLQTIGRATIATDIDEQSKKLRYNRRDMRARD